MDLSIRCMLRYLSPSLDRDLHRCVCFSRRVQYEDYLFDLNGYSPLTEKFLRSSHMLRKAGTQMFVPHPQITQVPSVSAESYEKEIQRAARLCRLVRAEKNLYVLRPFVLSLGRKPP